VATLPGIHHQQAIRAFQKAGFRLIREGARHVIVRHPSGRMAVIPRHNPIHSHTMGRIVIQAGLTLDEFRKLL
jgi:predicted RNA binding protein YcfA (HicA-like mRNA interferase family)